MYAEVIDRFLLLDKGTLTSSSSQFIVYKNMGAETLLRLVALGLMVETTDTSPFTQSMNGNIGLTVESLKRAVSTDRVYERTEFGEKLANILR